MTTSAEVPETEEKAPAEGKPAPTKRTPQGTKPKMRRAGYAVEHKATGRTRVRLSKEYRTPEHMASIEKHLSEHPDVKNVKINQKTGSVVIQHNHERDGREVIAETFKGVELLAGLLLEVPIGEDEEGEGGGGEYGKLDQKLADLTSRFDEWQAQKTGIHGRGVVISGAVAGLGVAQMVIYGISLEMLPGPMLLYIAYDIHRKVREEEMAREGRGKKAVKKEGDSSEPTGSSSRARRHCSPPQAELDRSYRSAS